MLRKLAIAIAASGAMSAAQVYALGLGEIELDSALNQPLDARIKLVKASELENWEIKPSLASADEFEGAGVERVFFLNNMKFEVEREGDNVFVNLSTQQPVVEPFLNFLVQVDWPNGRLLREYTLLLDPPVFNDEQAAEPVSAPEQQAQQEDPLPGTGVATQPAAQTIPVSVPEPIVEESTYEPEPEADQESTYKVRSNDTLWEIALEVRPASDISPQQVMLAIQDENPEAFIRGNINRLKNNQVLRIPSESDMRSRTFRESVAEVAAQNQVIDQRRAQLDATRKSEIMDRDDQVSDAQLTLLAEGSATSEGKRQASGQVNDRAAGDQSKLDQELSLALENLDKSNRENQELRSRLEALEEQINTLQRLINLKDEQMVALQTGMADSSAKETTQESAPVNVQTAENEKAGALADKGTDLNFASNEEGNQAVPADKSKHSETPAPASDAVKKPYVPKALPPVPPPKGPMDFVMENLPFVGGGLGAILLGLLGLRALRNRKSENEEEKENAFMAETMDDLADHPMDGSADSLDDDFADLELGDNVVDGDASDLPDLEGEALDLSGSGTGDAGLPDALDEHHESSDVLGEADMYMAYGRLDRAKDLLETTLLTEPARLDLKLKLLEVLSEQDDAVAFAEQFENVMAEGDEEQKAEANRLRQNLSNPDAGTANEAVLDSDLSGGEELDFSEFETDDLGLPEDSTELDLTDEDNDLDFDLGGLELDSDLAETTESTSELSGSDENSLDFELNLDADNDLSDGSLDLEIDSESDETSLDFDLGEEDTIDADLDLGSDLDLEMDSVDAELPTLDDDLEDGLDLSDTGDDLSLDADLPTLDMDDDNDLSLDGDSDLALDTDSNMAELEELDSELSDLDLDLDTEGVEDISLADLEAELDDDLTLDASTESELPELSLDDDDDLSLDAQALDLEADDVEALPELSPEPDFDTEVASETNEVESEAAESEPETLTDSDETETAESTDSDDLNLDDLDDDLDFLSGTDESETKLDLARAYIDMDDKDGAREILGEVLEEGNDEQRQEATKLMDSLS